jgi:glycosyltransferase involved in cell wall biosynthesis
MEKNNIVLTLAIPTYNRALILDQALKIIEPQLKNAGHQVEFIISDNASSDDTPEIVNKYINCGMDIRYIRNQENLGPGFNIIQCMKEAKGKYVWVLGDDDYLADNALNYILKILCAEKEYGFIFCSPVSKGKGGFKEYTNEKKFISDVSYFITFISSSIVNKKFVDNFDFDAYELDFLSWVAVRLWFTAIIGSTSNIYIKEKIFFSTGIDYENNGGYNYFEVFVERYLTVWKECAKTAGVSIYLYEKEKFCLFKGHIIYYIYRLLFRKRIGNFQVDNAWRYLIKYYWYNPYFYFYIVIYFIRSLLKSLIVVK